jgi:site-specific DNA-adenine methylase
MIVEPFAGSACYSLHYWERNVILCDIDPVIAGIWRWLINDATPEIVLSLPHPTLSQNLNDFTFPCLEAKSLMGFWVHQADSKPCNVMTRGGAFKTPKDYHTRVANQLEYIRHWRVYELDYRRLSNREATWFIDPPYQGEGKRYAYGSKLINYNHLGEWCQSRDGQVIVCESAGSDWLPFREFARNQNARNNGNAGFTKEVVWLNDQQQTELAA